MKTRLLRTILAVPGVLAVKWRRLQPGLYCFNYHRVGYPRQCDHDREVFSCTPERFEEQVLLLRQRFNLVGAERLRDYLDGECPSDRPLALITFDDGYVDNYLHAFPILRKHRAPALFFLPTAYVGTRRVPWWDRVAWLLRHSRRPNVCLDGWPAPRSLAGSELERTIRDTLRWLKTLPAGQMPLRIDELREACGAPADGTEAPEPLFLDWDQAREMAAAGMAFGSHTHTHPILSHLDAEAQAQELSYSKKVLENELGVAVTTVSYPDGDRSSYNATTLRLVKALGYEVGFSYCRQANRLPVANPFEVGRIGVIGDADGHRFRSLTCYPHHFS